MLFTVAHWGTWSGFLMCALAITITLSLTSLIWRPPTGVHARTTSGRASPCMESRFRIRSRLAKVWRRSSTPEPADPRVAISTLVAATDSQPLSTAYFDAFSRLAEARAACNFKGSVAVSVASGEWCLVTCKAGTVVDCVRLPPGDPPTCDACVVYADERTFAAMMDDALMPAAAVATGRLRIRGSLKLASASEMLYVAAEVLIRRLRGNATLASVQEVESRRRAEEDERAARLHRRLAAAAQRPSWLRWRARHMGTDQQVGAALLVLGSIAYSGYCALALFFSAAVDTTANELYLASSLLWLLGSLALIHSSYPERVLALAALAESDAQDPSRLEAMTMWERHFGASSLLLGAWGLGLGAPTFLAGAVVDTSHHPSELIPYLYDAAGVYLFVATGLLVLGARPLALADNGGAGSTRLQNLFGGGTFWSVHAANDLLAGTLFFSVTPRSPI